MRAFVLRILLLFLMLAVMLFLVPGGELLLNAYAQEAQTPALVPLPLDDSPGYEPNKDCYLPDGTGYEDASLSVRIETTRAYDTTIQVIRVKIADPSQLRTAMSARYGSTYTNAGATIARRNNAVLAINGDYFNFNNRGYLVRQGKLYRDLPDGGLDTLIIDDKGDLHIIPKATKELIAAFPGKIVNSFNFGPGLVLDGKLAESFETDNLSVPDKRTQRIGIGQTGPLSYLCVATEGPENTGSQGLTLPEFAKFLYDLGCLNAYNLDGGSSSTVVLNNKKINALSTGKTRPVCDILYFATAIPPQ